MPIPFRDSDTVEELGAAAFLTLCPAAGGTGYLGALLLINARGEPLEFAYNRVETPDTFLWRGLDLRRHAERKLTASLLTICARTPRLLLCRADEVRSELFCEDLRLEVPVGRVGEPLKATAYSSAESEERLEDLEDSEEPAQIGPLHLFWFPKPPPPDCAPRRLFDQLRARGLLLEPFQRAVTGLREVYAADVAQ